MYCPYLTTGATFKKRCEKPIAPCPPENDHRRWNNKTLCWRWSLSGGNGARIDDYFIFIFWSDWCDTSAHPIVRFWKVALVVKYRYIIGLISIPLEPTIRHQTNILETVPKFRKVVSTHVLNCRTLEISKFRRGGVTRFGKDLEMTNVIPQTVLNSQVYSTTISEANRVVLPRTGANRFCPIAGGVCLS